MRTETTQATSIHKVRREVRGGKRGDGDRRAVRIRRADPTRIGRGRFWSALDYTVQAFVTNDWTAAAEELAFEYDGRAEVEPAIGELKSGWGIGKIPSQDFHANHAVFLLKLLAHNIMRRFVRWTAPHLSSWRIPWLRRALINIPGRLLRSGAGRSARHRSRASGSTEPRASLIDDGLPGRDGGKGDVCARGQRTPARAPLGRAAAVAATQGGNVSPAREIQAK
jgi:hypothetical protein